MGKHKKVVMAVVIGLAVIAAGAAIYYFFIARESQPEQTTEMQDQPMVVVEEVPEGEIIEPLDVELDASDELVRRLVGELSSHPNLARWLMSDNLIRKFVAAVTNIANGESPRSHIDFFQPSGNFLVIGEDDEPVLDPGSFKRYDLVRDVFISIDTDGFVKLYKQLTPAIQEAYRDLGYGDADFNATMKKAFLEMFNVPVVENRIGLEEDIVTYKMLDPGLESLSPAQKHLLRMGPDNVRAIQAKLEEIAQALGFEN